MSLSYFCFIIGILELLFGVPMLVNPTAMTGFAKWFMGCNILPRLLGLFLLATAVLVLRVDYRVEWDVAGIVKLTVWVTAFKGINLTLFPKWNSKFFEKFLETPGQRSGMGILAVGVGMIFIWAGFVLR